MYAGSQCAFRGVRLVARLLAGWSLAAWAEPSGLIVYRDVPGAKPSDQYALSVREMEGDGIWQPAFAFITRCQPGIEGRNAYFPHLSHWSNTYINFEMVTPVEVEIRRLDGEPIRRAAVHPRRRATACVVRDGRVVVTLEHPGLIAVDLDGRMDAQDTGMGYRGPPIHTVTLFANPPIPDRPSPKDPGVYAVRPGETAPSEGPWKTLYFLPGVHDIGVGFPLHANRNYYLPGDALVYGTMNNHGDWTDGHHIRIFGYGTLSGARIAHPRYAHPRPVRDDLHNPIHIVDAANTTVEGLTLADSAHHSLMLIHRHAPETPTDIRWVKIFTWRANGDGINPFGNGLVEDCFLRTQDDAVYVNGRGLRRLTIWND